MYKLRELIRDDLRIINEWRNDPELIACLGAPYRFINLDVDNAWFDNYMKNRTNTVRCAIVDEDTNELFGLVSLVGIDFINQLGEFHIMIGNKDNQGKGAGTFATREILKHAFYNMNLHRIELTVLDSNKRAIHMYEKIGFTREGTKREVVFKNGNFVDMHIYSILSNEFIMEDK